MYVLTVYYVTWLYANMFGESINNVYIQYVQVQFQMIYSKKEMGYIHNIQKPSTKTRSEFTKYDETRDIFGLGQIHIFEARPYSTVIEQLNGKNTPIFKKKNQHGKIGYFKVGVLD